MERVEEHSEVGKEKWIWWDPRATGSGVLILEWPFQEVTGLRWGHPEVPERG